MKKELKIKIKKSAQEMQDEIFRKMTVDQKLELAVGLWRLGRELSADKINYARNHRPQKSFNKNS